MDAVVQGSSQPCLPWMDDRDYTAPVNNTHVCSDSANFPGWRKCIVLLVPFFIKCRYKCDITRGPVVMSVSTPIVRWLN